MVTKTKMKGSNVKSKKKSEETLPKKWKTYGSKDRIEFVTSKKFKDREKDYFVIIEKTHDGKYEVKRSDITLKGFNYSGGEEWILGEFNDQDKAKELAIKIIGKLDNRIR